LRTRRLRSTSASDEGAAAFMAAGYAKASGRVGVLTTIPGPGFVYALAGVVEAQHDSLPLLWLTLRQPDDARAFQLQRIDQAAMARPVVKRCLQVEHADELARVLREAYAEAVTGEPGPVLLEVAAGLLEAECARTCRPRPLLYAPWMSGRCRRCSWRPHARSFTWDRARKAPPTKCGAWRSDLGRRFSARAAVAACCRTTIRWHSSVISRRAWALWCRT
jgi:acetolactate synthase-1/2/3 large subunit